MKTRIDNITIYDGRGGKELSSSILFDETGILAFACDISTLEADEIIDGTGLTLTPGWFNCHSHIALDGEPNMQAQIRKDNSEAAVIMSAMRNSLRCLKSGLVSVKDMGTAFDASIKLRDAINEGRALGPNIYPSGRVICMTGGHGADFGYEVDGADEARKAARMLIKNGADHLKIMATGGGQSKGMKAGVPQLTYEEILAIVEEAHKAGVITSAHAQGKEGVMNCLRAGVDTIEHGVTLDDEQIELMIKNETFFCPTLMSPYYVVLKGVESGIPPHAVEKCKGQVDTHFEGFRKAVDAGVRIIAGNDAGTPFNYQSDMPSEFRMMIELGMTVREVITSATYTAAQNLRLEHKTGSIELGKFADLTIMSGDPEDDTMAFNKVCMVYKKGKLLYKNKDGEDWFANAL